jgi:diketogulonate reductase-like aldo/keto reductase
MRYRTFGSTGAQVSIIGQGTWQMEKGDRKRCIAALRRGLDAGMNHIDTAEMYGSGAVEELVGEAIAGRRDEVFLVSKVLPDNASRRGTVTACVKSLKRLRTDRLDVYLLHWPSTYPLDGTIAAFEELRGAGKIRAWGLSNFDVDELSEALGVAGGAVSAQKIPACDQVYYHLQERAVEHAVLPFCAEHGSALVAYSPLGAGSFPSPRSKGGRVLAQIAAAHAATPHQVALAFLTREPSSFAIPKSANPDHAAANAAAGDLVLAAEEIRRIEEAFPRGPRRPLPVL